MAGLSDILSSAQNIVQAINGVGKTYLNVQGAKNQPQITAATLVSTTPGRLAMVSITVAGAAGAIYDTNSVTSTDRLIWVIPASLGLIFVNLPFSYGLLVVPGAGQEVTVSYS